VATSLNRPIRDSVRDGLGTVLEPDERWYAALGCESVEGGDDGSRVDGAVDDDGRALTGVLVDHVGQLEGGPSTVTSNWKFMVHRAFRRIGHIAPTWEPAPLRRFLPRL
jgi:hypothetical protein